MLVDHAPKYTALLQLTFKLGRDNTTRKIQCLHGGDGDPSKIQLKAILINFRSLEYIRYTNKTHYLIVTILYEIYTGYFKKKLITM